MIRHFPAIWAVEQSTDPATDPVVKAAMDTAAWTASLTLATWFLFVAAVVAAYFAYRTWVDTKNQLNESRAQTTEARRQADAATEQLDRAAEADEQSEARHVAAWLRGDPGQNMELYVRNGNPGPVYDVQVDLLAKAKPEGAPGLWIGGHRMAALPPAASEPLEWAKRTTFFSEGLVAAHDRPLATPDHPGVYPRDTAYAVFAQLNDFQVWDGSPLTTGVALELTFKDSLGIRWKRDWHGKLAKLS